MARPPSLAAIRVFEAAARHENFTRAAAELGMTQAAVSYQMRLLEQQLGVPLFIRDRGRVRLAPDARAFAATITDALGSIAEAVRRLHEGDGQVLTVSCSNTVAVRWLAPRLGRFQLLRPEIAVRLHISEVLEGFGRIDAALRTTARPADHLHAVRLMAMHAVPMCSPALLARFAPATPVDLLAMPLISRDDAWWRDWFAHVGVAPASGPAGGIRLDSQAAEAAAATAGHGVAILTPELWRDEIAAGRLVAPFDQPVATGLSLWFVCPRERRAAPKLKAFGAWLRAELG